MTKRHGCHDAVEASSPLLCGFRKRVTSIYLEPGKVQEESFNPSQSSSTNISHYYLQFVCTYIVRLVV